MSLNVVVYHVVEYVQAPAVGPLIAFEIDSQPPTTDAKLPVNQRCPNTTTLTSCSHAG